MPDYMPGDTPDWKCARAAGYAGDFTTLSSSASAVLKSTAVQAEIARRREEITVSQGINLDTLVFELRQNALDAREYKQMAASNQAWLGVAKLLGFLVDRTESRSYSVSADITKALASMSPEELRAIASLAPALELPEGKSDD